MRHLAIGGTGAAGWGVGLILSGVALDGLKLQSSLYPVVLAHHTVPLYAGLLALLGNLSGAGITTLLLYAGRAGLATLGYLPSRTPVGHGPRGLLRSWKPIALSVSGVTFSVGVRHRTKLCY